MSHITKEQRYTIEVLLSRGESQAAIAMTIGRDKSVVSREIRRNCDRRSGRYRADLAQRKYEQRQAGIPKRKRFTAAIRATVEGLLREDYSPEQIAGYCRAQGVECVSHERIYQHVWADKKGGGALHTHLRRRGRRYRKRGAGRDTRGVIAGRVDIALRPQEAQENRVFGHLEADTIIGRNRRGAILTLNDRASGFLWMKRLKRRTRGAVHRAALALLMEVKEFLRTITSDNGKEFADHQKIAGDLGVGFYFYFAKPYHPWERGANENLNGLVRQYIPKKTDLDTIDDEYIQWVADRINSRPRKRFNYKNPTFVKEELLTQGKVAFVA